MKQTMIGALGVICALSAAPAFAQGTYPSKAVRVVVPYPAGGTTDIVARIVAQKLAATWGRQVLIDNRAGAGGNIGKEIAARATPDGYTLLMAGVSYAINPSLYKNCPYDPRTDFAPITQIASTPQILEVHPALPVSSVKQLIAVAKSRPGQLLYGSAGSGTTLHLSAELFNAMAGVKMTHVPYKGVTAALVDLMAGEVQVIIDSLPASLPYVKAGRVKGLAVTSAARAAAVPDLPTISEAGVKGYEATSWYGFFAPAQTPADVLKKLQADAVTAIRAPDVQAQLQKAGADPIANTSEQFATVLQQELAKWAKVVQISGARVD